MKISHASILVMRLIFTGFSCKKAIEQKQDDLILKAITDGSWMVEQYFENGSNISYEFLNYDFKFNGDGTVIGTISGDTTKGTWSGSSISASITSTFPTSSTPLVKLNAVWKITDSYWDYVEAKTTIGSDSMILHLRKK
jgi:hypothetical protein